MCRQRSVLLQVCLCLHECVCVCVYVISVHHITKVLLWKRLPLRHEEKERERGGSKHTSFLYMTAENVVTTKKIKNLNHSISSERPSQSDDSTLTPPISYYNIVMNSQGFMTQT